MYFHVLFTLSDLLIFTVKYCISIKSRVYCTGILTVNHCYIIECYTIFGLELSIESYWVIFRVNSSGLRHTYTVSHGYDVIILNDTFLTEHIHVDIHLNINSFREYE